MIVSEPVIRMENIIKRYYIGKPNELQILNGISLSVDQGEFVSIVGESGSGKSTLMNIIGVLDRQTEGTYFLEGKDVNKMDDSMRSAIRNKRIGFVFQNFNLLPKANALKNVMVPLLYSTEKEKNQKERAMEMLKMVGMEERAFHKPNELSGGQKQRVAIARALAMKPEVMLFDEPTSALDPTMVDEVESVIRRLVDAGMTSIIVTHEMRFAKNIASNVMFMAEQGIYEHGTAQEVIGHPSKELTRRFMYRARMFERNVTKDDIDIYSLCSEIRQFALSFGLTARQSRGIEYLCDELLLPLLRSDKNGGHHAVVQVIAGENTADYQLILQFPTLAADPLESDIMDEMGRKIVSAFTKSLKSEKNAEGLWEVHAEL